MNIPKTQYAKSGGASIAYQAAGDGDINLVVVTGPASHVEIAWEEPQTRRSFERLASFARVIWFDRRGTGLSDPFTSPPTLEMQMDDLAAVLEAVGIERTALFAGSDLGLCAMYAATFPERVTHLVLNDVAPQGGVNLTPQMRERLTDAVENSWGDGTLMSLWAPSQVGNRAFEEWWARMQRSAASPAMARQIIDMIAAIDLRPVLPTIQTPTLVMHHRNNEYIPIEYGRQVASLIPGARFVERPGADTYGWLDEDGLDEVEEFLTGRVATPEIDRILATVLFTDIVGSTEHAARIGDSQWRRLLDEHYRLVRHEIATWRGNEVKTIGDGFLATFDGPARAVRAARRMVEGAESLGLSLRAGLHTGECELVGGDVAGMAVHIGARVMGHADGGEVLASSTVKDLVVGSDLRFADRGVHALKGVPDEWRLYALER